VFVDEYQELHDAIVRGDYPAALALIDEMDEMSRDGEVRRIGSFMRILLVHLIKRDAEGRTTRSWDVSVRNALREITRTNTRRKGRGRLLDDAGLADALAETWEIALDYASLEVRGGAHTTTELAGMVDRDAILAEAMRLIEAAQES